MTRLILLVALTDSNEPLVLGCAEEELCNILDQTTVDNTFRTLKNMWYPDAKEIREIIIEVPEDQLLAAFAKPVIEAEIVK